MAGLSEHTPMYLSPRSADVVLSEIRPTKLAPEALRSVNVLLDELLWMILSTARSFSTEQLKAGMNRLLPTALGKEALLEAEVELKAYWDRTTGAPSRPYAENAQEFPLQPAFELLRLKCEAYSTFNDTDEDVDVERRWQTKVAGSTGFSSNNLQFIAPAALYLTAIIEHVCEHILSNTGRVATRDSSRSTATLQDLFTALCEDDPIYGLFKNMKVHNQIEMQSKAMFNRPRRSKSFQRSMSDHIRGSSRATNSPFDPVSNGNVDAALAPAKPRGSSESTGSGTAIATVPSSSSRSSTEKSKAKKLFGRMSIDKEGGSQNGSNVADSGHKRSISLISNGKYSVTAMDDGPGSSPSEVEFDELMRSGTTMKVSLTPDRLRTFDVYNKEKGRGAINKIVIPAPIMTSHATNKAPLQDSPAINSAAEATAGQAMKKSYPQQQRQVDAIEEDEDVLGKDFNGARTRKQSKGAPPVSYEVPPPMRTRSASTSQTSVSSLGSRHAVGRKGSLSAFAIESPHSQSLRAMNSSNNVPKTADSTSSTFTGRRVQQSLSRDSIDDILNGSSEEDMPVKKAAGRRRAPTVGVTSQTADLIDFLNSGPPDLPKAISPSISPIDNRMKRGRLRSIVSRLKGGSSTEKLSNYSSSSLDDSTMSGKKSLNHPPQSFVPPPLSAKRSLHSISSYSHSQVSLPKPPPPPVPPVSMPLSPPLSPTSSQALNDSTAMPPPRSKPVQIGVRKAVPTFTDAESSRRAETTTVLLDAPRTEGSAPPTPSKMDSETNRTQPQVKPPTEDTSYTPSVTAVVPSVRKSSISAQSPPYVHIVRPSSKQAQRHAFTPPGTPAVFASQAKDMRRLMANATTADECRLLVDMFLAQSGLPMKAAEFQPDPVLAPSAQQETAVVEALLSNGDALNGADEEKVAAVGIAAASIVRPGPGDYYSVTTVYGKTSSDMHTSPMTMAQTVVSAEA
ncbi:hypothetical protein M0805_005762 [Coniferiporia weirii]|nr:hypothetical protein M0805_005762 [Coniferiporia weirii]